LEKVHRFYRGYCVYSNTLKLPRVCASGSRFCRVEEPDKSVEMLTAALDNGLYYWDTAPNYTTPKVISEERLGLVLKDRRKEVLVATKVEELSADGTMRGFEQSLKRLQTDYVDILQVHSVDSPEEVEKIGGKGGAFEAMRRLKEEMGIECSLVELFSFTYMEKLDNELTEHELDHVFFGVSDKDPVINISEVEEWKTVSFEDLHTDILENPADYTYWFKKIYENVNMHLTEIQKKQTI